MNLLEKFLKKSHFYLEKFVFLLSNFMFCYNIYFNKIYIGNIISMCHRSQWFQTKDYYIHSPLRHLKNQKNTPPYYTPQNTCFFKTFFFI